MSTYIEDALYQYLVDHATVGALVGGPGTGSRIYEGSVPQNTPLDYIWFERISNPKAHTLTKRSDMDEGHYEFTVVAKTRAQRKALADALVDALDHKTGLVEEVHVHGILQEDEGDDFVPEKDGSDRGRFETTLPFVVFTER